MKYTRAATVLPDLSDDTPSWFAENTVIIFNYENQGDIAVINSESQKFVYRKLKETSKWEEDSQILVYTIKAIDENGDPATILYNAEKTLVTFTYSNVTVCFSN